MGTWRASLDADKAVAERLAAIISETIEDSAAAVTENGPLWRLEAYFPNHSAADIMEDVLVSHASGEVVRGYTLEPLPDEDWVTLVQRGLRPVRTGGFFIHGSHDRTAAVFEPRAIEIDAGRAFGTAHHGTTQGCLAAIGRLARRGGVRTVLDVGTGSGVLAIAAAKAGARSVLATDIDPVAVAVARENCLKNGVAAQVDCVCAPGVRHPRIAAGAPYDLITANILAEPLVTLARGLHALARPGGFIVLSGLLDAQAPRISGFYRSMGCAFVERHSVEGWTTLVLRRR